MNLLNLVAVITCSCALATADVDLCRRTEDVDVDCDVTSPYREIDGLCNNIQTPSLKRHGSPRETLPRLLAPKYDNDRDFPRTLTTVGKEPLPSARLVSWRVNPVETTADERYSHLLMMWGQFFNHGIAKTARASSPQGGAFSCSRCDSNETESKECFPIQVPAKDANFGPEKLGVGQSEPRCLPFTRSRAQVSTLRREQFTEITSFIDASNVYGSDRCTARDVREFSGGRLRTQESRTSGALLPGTQKDGCGANSCFIAGDERSNQNLGLTSLHTLWVREHNRIADDLQGINSKWDDERIYQEARRLVGALLQNIMYSEYLPKIIGNDTMKEYGLDILDDGYYTGYDSSCSATILNEFATAAFRFGHTLIQSKWLTISTNGTNGTVEGSINLRSTFFKPAVAFHGDLIDSVPRGMAQQPCAKFDRTFSEDVAENLFGNQDLVSRNIQRGRDHGLQPYIEYRRHFGFAVPKDFHDLLVVMRADTVEALKSVYKSVEDIDLYTGLVSEEPLSTEAVVGPTAARIIAEQFRRLRRCDRFWFENGGQPGSFGLDQLRKIRHQKLSQVLCRNLVSLKNPHTQLQKEVFSLPSAKNPPIACSLFNPEGFNLNDDWDEDKRPMPCATTKFTFNNINKYSQQNRGKLWSPDYPNQYRGTVDCTYNILKTSETLDKPIILTFTHFHIENGYDFLTLYDDGGNTFLTKHVFPFVFKDYYLFCSGMIRAYCSITGEFADPLPKVFTSNGNMRIRFHSDLTANQTHTATGFRATFENGFAL